MLTQCIPSRPCAGPAGAPQMWFFCTENNLLQKPRRRFHIQHCVSDSPARLMSHWRGLHPRRCVSPTVKAKGELSTASESPVSGAYPVANLLHLYYPCGSYSCFTNFWAGAVKSSSLGWGSCWETFACCSGERVRRGNGRSDVNSWSLPKSDFSEGRGKKNLFCLFFFFFFLKKM